MSKDAGTVLLSHLVETKEPSLSLSLPSISGGASFVSLAIRVRKIQAATNHCWYIIPFFCAIAFQKPPFLL